MDASSIAKILMDDALSFLESNHLDSTSSLSLFFGKVIRYLRSFLESTNTSIKVPVA